LFFALGWPLIVAILFGIVFSGGGGESGKPRVALVDLDQTAGSKEFATELKALSELDVDEADEAKARDLVRQGQRVGAVLIPPGFGEASKRLFHGDPPKVQIVADPSRKAEQAMLNGMLQKVAGQRFGRLLTDQRSAAEWLPQARQDVAGLDAKTRASMSEFFDSLERMLAQQQTSSGPGAKTSGGAGGWQPLAVDSVPVTRASMMPANAFAITFPQGLLWGIVGCVMSFAASMVTERMQGTLMRLQASPMSPMDIMLGKALACFLAISAMATGLLLIAWLGFGVRPESLALLVIAVASSAFAFTGIMMLIASLGRTLQTVGGAGWAIMMPLMLFGGGMMPVFVMPAWMKNVGGASPARWALNALEGALWRGFSFAEMAQPALILVAIGALSFAIGVRRYRRLSA
jgi:ABC-2 type transport system permease protein